MDLNKKDKLAWMIMGLIILLGLALRIIFLKRNLHNFNLYGDALNYHVMANQWVHDGVFGYHINGIKSGTPNAYVTPGYPFVIAFVCFFVKNSNFQLTIVRLVQVFVSSITALVAFLFVKKLFKRLDAGILLAFFMTIYSSYIESPFKILTEVFALAFMILYFYFAVIGFCKKKWYLNFITGFIFAAEVLIRPAILPLFIAPYIYLFFTYYKNNRKELLKIFCVMVIGFSALMSPWWIRNLVTMHKPIITCTQSGNPLLAGTYPYITSGPKFFKDFTPKYRKMGCEWFAKKRIIHGFTTQPFLYLKWYTVGKLYDTFKQPWLYGDLNSKAFDNFLHFFIITAGLLGLFYNSVKDNKHLFVNIYGLVFAAIYLMFIPTTRYGYQTMFFLMLSAAFFIVYMKDKVVYLIGKIQ